LYGENLSQSKVSESVAGTIATSLSGADAYDVLSRLLRNTTNVVVYSYVDVTSYVLLMNLPVDVVYILPWSSPATVTGIAQGPTGAMPSDFWQKIGAAASTVVNSLVVAGQMVYKGLVALGTFLVNLAEAIADLRRRLAMPLCPLQAIEAAHCMKDYRKIAEDFARHLKATYGDRINRIILFGSVARGDYREDSDVDLLVVTSGDWFALQEKIVGDAVDWLLRTGVYLSTMVVTAADYDRLGRMGFGRAVAAEGVLLG